MTQLSGGQAAVEALRAERTRHVFGLIGSATMELFDALYDASDISFIGVRDERTGTHMADGYARVSGDPGVILAGQNGPGATNLVTGLSQAKAAFSPVVSIAGALSSAHVYRDAFQEVDQQSVFTPVTKKTWTAPSTDRVPELFREAFRTAMTPRRGPVQLNLPRDVLSGQATFEMPMQRPEQYRHFHLPGAHPDAIAPAARLLTGARQPALRRRGGAEVGGDRLDLGALRLDERAAALSAREPLQEAGGVELGALLCAERPVEAEHWDVARGGSGPAVTGNAAPAVSRLLHVACGKSPWQRRPR